MYDANKCVTGKTFIKGEQVPKGYFYLIVTIVIKNGLDKYLIQKRVERKGGKWVLELAEMMKDEKVTFVMVGGV